MAGRTDFELLPSPEAGRAVLDSIQTDARDQVRVFPHVPMNLGAQTRFQLGVQASRQGWL
ncbi:hypothetical protein ACFWNN_38050 [Lentzea sp. NPDC058450]|uniref:hypothetical protein n=1 Tax=Lentzea sp. NPDC058450 TaxID=3346505 RepID=UPI00365A8EA0